MHLPASLIGWPTISGRKASDNGHKSANINKANPAGKGTTGTARLVHKLGEIYSKTNETNRILRNYLGHGSESQMPPRVQSTQNPESNKTNVEERLVDMAHCQNYSRSHQLRCICGPPRQITQPYDPKTSKSAPGEPQTQEVSSTGESKTRSSLVVDSRSTDLSHTLRRSDGLCYNRCIRSRVGGHSKRREIYGDVVSHSNSMAQQPKRVVDAEKSPARYSSHLWWPNSLSSDGQQNCSSIYNQRRGYQITRSITANHRHSRTRSPSPDPSCGKISTREIQLDGRQPITISSDPRMDPIEAHVEHHIQRARETLNRSFCELAISSGSSLRKRRRSRSCMRICECLQQTMALQPCLDISPTLTHTPRVTSPSKEFRNILAGAPKVGENVLESRAETESSKAPVPNLEPTQTSDRLTDRESTSSRRKAIFAGMEGSGWAHLIDSWDEENKKLLESAWRKSSLKTYKSAWERWCSWAKGKCPVDSPNPHDIAKFVCFLHSSLKLAPSTIAVHKSVVATFANPMKSDKLSGHPVV